MRFAVRYLKAKRGEPFRNWARLKHQDYVAEVGFRRLLVTKIRRALGPILLDFFTLSAIFLRKWRKGESWAEPCTSSFFFHCCNEASEIEAFVATRFDFFAYDFSAFPSAECFSPSVTLDCCFRLFGGISARKEITDSFLCLCCRHVFQQLVSIAFVHWP